ncbi:MAG TPA: hypothetical protein DHV07_00290, partial [Flavobacteriales bacterium]|nr:hypothetical protein [Flavobacteriales bacterium]
MKSWEDILKGRFARHADPGKPDQNEALWNAIEAGMAAPPAGAKAAGVAQGVSGSAGKFWSWALGTAAVMGLVSLGVVFWPKAGPTPPQEGTRVEQSQDVQSAPMTALDSEEGEGTPSVSEEVSPSASNEGDLTLPAEAKMAPEVSVAQAGSDAAQPEAAVAAETMPAEVGASVATAEVAPTVETRTTGAESAPTVSSEPAPTSAKSGRLPLLMPRMETDGEENVARARSVGGELPPGEGPEEVKLEPLPLRSPSSGALPLAQLLPMEGAIHAEAPFALRTFGG